jgi:hypothetical protein
MILWPAGAITTGVNVTIHNRDYLGSKAEWKVVMTMKIILLLGLIVLCVPGCTDLFVPEYGDNGQACSLEGNLCKEGLECYQGQCCKDKAFSVCMPRGDAYWLDSCGNQRELYQDCDECSPCVEDIETGMAGCKTIEELPYKQCGTDGHVHWYHVCGIEGEIAESCNADTTCVNSSNTQAYCAGGCEADCGDRECGLDPVCNTLDCGTCAGNETCNADGMCDSNCIPNCGNRECGLDPLCNTLDCGTCAGNETCNADGMCDSNCIPYCGNRECGLDPVCDTLDCGSCNTGESCIDGVCVSDGAGANEPCRCSGENSDDCEIPCADSLTCLVTSDNGDGFCSYSCSSCTSTGHAECATDFPDGCCVGIGERFCVTQEYCMPIGNAGYGEFCDNQTVFCGEDLGCGIDSNNDFSCVHLCTGLSDECPVSGETCQEQVSPEGVSSGCYFCLEF